MKLAKAQHAWGLKILKNKKWMREASDMSKGMAHEYASSTVEELAERSYAYSKMRYKIAKYSGFNPAYAFDVRMWKSIHNGVHPNTKVFSKKV